VLSLALVAALAGVDRIRRSSRLEVNSG
jgi:hypothetical protein